MIIREDDEFFIHFIIIAFLSYHKDEIVTTDHSQIPSVLSQLCIKSIEEVESVISIAKDLRNKTPFSIRLLANKLEIFKPYSTELKQLFFFYQPENFLAMPILASEIFFIAYNNIVTCPDIFCKNFRKYFNNDNDPNFFYGSDASLKKENIKCYFCEQKNTKKTQNNLQIPYILLDLRIAEEKNNKNYDTKPGFLPMTVILDQDELLDEHFAENLTDRFLNEKDKYHFILITSETDYFNDFEGLYYKENISETQRRKMMYGLQTRVSKEINQNVLNQHIKKDKSKRLQIKMKEFDNLKKLINSFMSKNYPYVSYVYGGFKDIHEESFANNIPLLNHDENCYICKKNRKKSVKKGFFSKIFKSNKSNKNEKSVIKKSENNNEELKLTESKKKDTQITVNVDKSKINVANINDKIIENLNKIENDVSNLYTIEEISLLISNPEFIVFTCLLVEYKHLLNKHDQNDKPQIMLFLNDKEIKIYKLERNLTKLKLPENEGLSFVLIEVIKITEIITIITRKQTKNIVTIQFTSDLFGKTQIIIDLITDVDSKSFISKTKSIIEKDKNINK